MASKGRNRAALPSPGGRQSDAPPLPARRAAPLPPQPNAAEEDSDDDVNYEEPSSQTELNDSQDLYDEFEMEQPPEINPYNPSKQEDQGEIYDEFEEVLTDEVYADPDEENEPPTLPPANFPKTHGSKAPPLPPMGNRRGSQPLPPPPRAKREDTPPPPPPIEDDIYDGPDDDDNDFYQEEDNSAPPPPPLPSANRPKVSKPPPTPQRKEKEKKAPANSLHVPQIGLSAIQGAIGKLRRVSDDKTIDDKNKKNEKNHDEKSKDKTSILSDLKSKLKPTKGSSSKEEKVEPKIDSGPPLPPRPPEQVTIEEKEPIKPPSLTQKTPPTPPTPTVEVVSLIPSYDDDDDGEIYDDAQTADLDPLAKYEWYHGKINRSDGNARLKGVGKDGTYLVRISDKDPKQPYTMQVLFEDRVNNLKVRLRDDKRFALGESKPNEITFKDVPGMITHHKAHPVLLIGTQQGEITLRETPKKN